MQRYSFRVEGRVQGVGFRYFVLQTAQNLHVTGWVRNRADGSVQGEVQGDEASVNEFFAKVRAGNGIAKVINMHYSSQEPKANERAFAIAR
jgi:acylphosphatase